MRRSARAQADFNSLYETYVTANLPRLSAGLGEPAALRGAEYEAVIGQMKKFRELYAHLSFWAVVDMRSLDLAAVEGAESMLANPVKTVRDFLRLVHPDYLEPYLIWGEATYVIAMQNPGMIAPMQISQRVTLPLLGRDGHYHWFSQHATVLQVDAQNRIIQHLNTYYDEGRWSARRLQPVEPHFSGRHYTPEELQRLLNAQMTPYIIDEFTNAELDLLSHYAAGETPERIMSLKNWRKHTLHEYNAHVMQKARRIFQYDFGTARDFAEYCAEKGFIQPKKNGSPM